MKRVLLMVVVVLILAFIGIQFVPVDRSNPPEIAPLQADAQILQVLQRSCFDCHSNQTVWPWYSYVAPVSWLVAKDVNEGREHLNFSEFGSLSASRQAHAREEVWEEVEEGGMPLPIYLKMHPQAKLSDADMAILKAWSGSKTDEENAGESHTKGGDDNPHSEAGHDEDGDDD